MRDRIVATGKGVVSPPPSAAASRACGVGSSRPGPGCGVCRTT